MRKLIMGIVEFREKRLPQYAKQFSELALTQAPDALLSDLDRFRSERRHLQANPYGSVSIAVA